MSEPKYTPGPWTVNRDNQGTLSVVRSLKRESKSVATILDGDFSNGFSMPVEANARLIAAAPDLLKALKNLLKEDLLCEHEGSARFRQVATKRRKAAQAAIAKAEGESHE